MVFEKIRKIIKEVITSVDESTITPQTSLREDLRADSIDAMEIIMKVEEQFKLPQFTVEESNSYVTIGDLVKAVESKLK
jgi:acyl carrier protein